MPENNYLIVVDMQKDFVDGALGSREAQAIVPAVEKKIADYKGTVIFTLDTHEENYLDTQEGRLLPVPHCIRGTAGWELVPPLEVLRQKNNCRVYEKNTFGSTTLAADLCREHQTQPISGIELVGLCTDICVVSNALLIKAFLPEVPVYVDAACCAGVTPEKHAAALETMKSSQIIPR
ncbi:MAG: cysteine hydrolase [Muribaculaceae bacterium]|nr:cysteine hydrolase [Roseburia sp.]MCM1430654.1 cysteine hydrolase [Muribaculaceae bacterium]MCM1491921.1 cysteine hydrolase [Muribaculaceae bacterium]